MSVAAINKFALLNDDADGTSPPPAKSKPQAVAAAAQPPETKGRSVPGSGGAKGGSGYYSRGGGAGGGAGKPSNRGGEGGDDSAVPSARFDRTEGRHERGRGRGERGRGGPRTGGAATRDRHSRTAIVDSDKQVNQGWGADTGRAELANETQAEADAAAEVVDSGIANDTGASWGDGGASWDTPADDAAAATGGAAATGTGDADGGMGAAKPVPEEDKTITYQEYLAQKAGAGLEELVGSVGPRLANEGKDLFKDVTKFERDDQEESYFVGKTKSVRTKNRGEKAEKVTIEIDGQFSEPPGGRGRGRGRGRGGGGGGESRGRGGGEGRGRGRGGFRGGGYQNGPAARSPAVDVDDTNMFPTLDRPAKK